MHATRLLVFALLLAGCPDRTISEVPVDQGKVEIKDIPAVPRTGLDILFVIDDSPSMVDEQQSLRDNFSRLIDVLESLDGGLPDVHIGVITPNLGASAIDGSVADPVGACNGQGGAGVLREQFPGGPRFLESFDDGAGGRTTNFTGTLDVAFADLANVGTNGCGIEQHLEAVKRATDGSNPQNASFLRSDAYLAVIVIADEDDCSLAKSTLFDAVNRGDPNYGLRTNFRCTSQGVACDSPAVDFEISNGVRQDCHPRFDSTELTQIDRYVDHLKSLKPFPDDDVLLAGIVGDPDPFEIVKPNNVTQLKDNCRPGSGAGGTTGVAVPAVRTADLINQFALNTRSTICDGDLSDGLEKIGELIVKAAEDVCFENDLLDTDPLTAGLQYDCSVIEVRRRPGLSDEEIAVYPPCGSGEFPCWRIEEDAVKCSFTDADPHLKIVIDRNGEVPTGDLRTKVQCVTTDSSGNPL